MNISAEISRFFLPAAASTANRFLRLSVADRAKSERRTDADLPITIGEVADQETHYCGSAEASHRCYRLAPNERDRITSGELLKPRQRIVSTERTEARSRDGIGRPCSAMASEAERGEVDRVDRFVDHAADTCGEELLLVAVQDRRGGRCVAQEVGFELLVRGVTLLAG
jgi:hypothetical protein